MRGSHLLPAARALALVRIGFGAILLIAGTGKMMFGLFLGFLPAPMVTKQWQIDLPTRLTEWLTAHPAGVVTAIVRDLVLPHGVLVAGVIAWAQLLVGLLLILGYFTRFAAGVAVLLAGCLALTAMATNSGSSRVYIQWGLLALALLIGNAGQTFGIDGWRREVRRGREF